MDTNRMERIDSVLLTPTGNKVHLHARDDSRSVQVNRLISENELTFAHYPVLSLSIADEAGLVLWSEGVYAYVFPEKPDEAQIESTFAVWESPPIGIETHGEAVDFSIRVYYTLNPD